jgi:hypothetical protein
MQRVGAAMSAIADVEAGRLEPDSAVSAINAIAKAPFHPTRLFTLAAAVGRGRAGHIPSMGATPVW